MLGRSLHLVCVVVRSCDVSQFFKGVRNLSLHALRSLNTTSILFRAHVARIRDSQGRFRLQDFDQLDPPPYGHRGINKGGNSHVQTALRAWVSLSPRKDHIPSWRSLCPEGLGQSPGMSFLHKPILGISHGQSSTSLLAGSEARSGSNDRCRPGRRARATPIVARPIAARSARKHPDPVAATHPHNGLAATRL
jgi:hypothetical protein